MPIVSYMCMAFSITTVYSYTHSYTYVTAVVDKPGLISSLRRINDKIFIYSEHIAAIDASCFVSLLSGRQAGLNYLQIN